MATNSKYTRVMVDEIDLSTMANNASATITAGEEDVTTFQASGKIAMVLDPELAIAIAGYYTDAVDGMEDVLQDRIDNAATVMVQFGTDEPGAPVYILYDANTSQFSVGAPIPGVITVSGEFAPGAPHRGVAIDWGVFTATGPGASVQLPAVTYDLYMLVHEIGGIAVDATVDIETSSDNTNWASAGTFPLVSAKGVYQLWGVTLDVWNRINIISMGGATSLSITFVAEPA